LARGFIFKISIGEVVYQGHGIKIKVTGAKTGLMQLNTELSAFY